MRECCSVHTWDDNLPDSLPHLNAAVTPETCSVYVAIRLTPHLNVVLERSLVAKLETREDVNPGREDVLPLLGPCQYACPTVALACVKTGRCDTCRCIGTLHGTNDFKASCSLLFASCCIVATARPNRLIEEVSLIFFCHGGQIQPKCSLTNHQQTQSPSCRLSQVSQGVQ